VRAIGLGVNEWEVANDALSATPLECVLLAGRYTLLEQGALPFMNRCAAQGVGVIIGGPFNSGLLAGQAKYNYGSVPHHMQERARALAETCAEFRVPLEAAALHFPLAHPAVVSVLAGMRAPEQVQANANWMRRALPDDLWTALRARSLIDAEAPLPAANVKEN
jgi:D-threo-aldose 1-dehydrogenase